MLYPKFLRLSRIPWCTRYPCGHLGSAALPNLCTSLLTGEVGWGAEKALALYKPIQLLWKHCGIKTVFNTNPKHRPMRGLQEKLILSQTKPVWSFEKSHLPDSSTIVSKGLLICLFIYLTRCTIRWLWFYLFPLLSIEAAWPSPLEPLCEEPIKFWFFSSTLFDQRYVEKGLHTCHVQEAARRSCREALSPGRPCLRATSHFTWAFGSQYPWGGGDCQGHPALWNSSPAGWQKVSRMDFSQMFDWPMVCGQWADFGRSQGI